MLIKSQDSVMDELEVPVISVTEFSMASAVDFARNIRRLNSDSSVTDIFINICSYGGQVWSMLGMIEEARCSPKLVHGICSGFCASAGAFMFSCLPGTRYMSSNARLMFHDVSSGISGFVPEMEKELKTLKNLSKSVFEILGKRVARSSSQKSLSLSDIKRTVREEGDWYVTSKKAVEYGFADTIGIPYFTKRVVFECAVKG
jgi:ATP-dependent Clp protease protease subunit